MAHPSSTPSSPTYLGKVGLGDSVHCPIPIGDDIEERMASISYLTAFCKVEGDEFLDLGSRAGGAGGVPGAVDLANPLVGHVSPRPGSGVVGDLGSGNRPVEQTSLGQESGGIRKDRVLEAGRRIASPAGMGDGDAERRGGEATPKRVVSPQPELKGEFTLELLEQWAREDSGRANDRGRLISSWYMQVESTREENYYLRERVDQLSEELQARSSKCVAAEKSLKDSRLTEEALRVGTEQRDNRIDELTRELEDAKSQLARAQRIAMEPTRALPVDVASSSDFVVAEGEPLFGVEQISARLLFYYRCKVGKALDFLSESHGFDLGVFERGGYSDRQLEAFLDKIPEAGVAPSYLLKP